MPTDTRQFGSTVSSSGIVSKTPPSTPDNQLHTLIDETMAASEATKDADSFGVSGESGGIRFRIDSATVPSNLDHVTQVKIAFHHAGTFIETYPVADFRLYAGSPSILFGEKDDVSLETQGEHEDSQLVFAGLNIPRADYLNLEMELDYKNGVGAPKELPPLPYEEPGN